MKWRATRKIAVFLAALMLTAVSAAPASAAWEEGINIAEPVTAAETHTEAYTQEAFVLETFALINAERDAVGLPALKGEDKLNSVAEIRAEEASVSFSHVRPDGTSCATAFADAGLSYQAAGENLAYGYATPEDMVNGWMNSKLHRANILNSNFEYAEIGYFKNDNGIIYCSMLFYTPNGQ